MAREPSQKLVDYGIIAGVALAGYVVWTMFFKKEAPKVCPAGQHAVNPCEGQMGWPAFLCNAGRNITGAFLDCKPDVPGGGLPCKDVGGAKCKSEGGTWKDAPDCTCTGSTPPGNLNCECMPGKSELCVTQGGKWHECKADRITPECTCEMPLPVVLPKDEHGCIIGVQHYCDTPDNKCRDNAQKCTPLTGKPSNCYEWEVLEGVWIYSPSLPGCGIITCPDGSQHYKEQCPVTLPKCKDSECTPGSKMCDNGISKICVPLGTGCEDRGFWSNTTLDFCKPPSNIVNCKCGKVDLNNPPGTTCESACKGYVNPGACKIPMGDAMRACGQTLPGKKFCCGNEAACKASGADIPYKGCWANQAQISYYDCFNEKCGYSD